MTTYTDTMTARFRKALEADLLSFGGWAATITGPLLPALDRETSEKGIIVALPPEHQFAVYDGNDRTYVVEPTTVELQPGAFMSFMVSDQVGLSDALQIGFMREAFIRDVMWAIADDCRKIFQRVGTTHKPIVYDPFTPPKQLYESYLGSSETTFRLLQTLRFIDAGARLKPFSFRWVIYPSLINPCFDSRMLPDVGWRVLECRTFERSDVEPAVYAGREDAFSLYVTEPGVKIVWFEDVRLYQVDMWINWGIQVRMRRDSMLDVIPIDNRSGIPY